jgi:hypothetical protein
MRQYRTVDKAGRVQGGLFGTPPNHGNLEPKVGYSTVRWIRLDLPGAYLDDLELHQTTVTGNLKFATVPFVG